MVEIGIGVVDVTGVVDATGMEDAIGEVIAGEQAMWYPLAFTGQAGGHTADIAANDAW